MRAKQKVKFEARLLKQEERFNSVRENKGWLVNLSSQDLSVETKRVIERGLNFAPTSKSIPKADIVASMEAALVKRKKLLPEEAERARATVAGLIVKAQPPRQNVSKKE